MDDDDGHLRTRDNNLIYDQTVVEFIYKESRTGYQWIPIKFRADKTVLQNPNSSRRQRVHGSQLKPVTLGMITGPQN